MTPARTLSLTNPADLALAAGGVFFMAGLLTGAWKYFHIHRTRDGGAAAPVYVDIAHRASLLYAFAAMLMREFVPYSPVGPTATWWAMAGPLAFFGMAIGTYTLHGLLNDTDNQFRAPHRLGPLRLPGVLLLGFMVALAGAEIGGFTVLLWGVLGRLRV